MLEWREALRVLGVARVILPDQFDPSRLEAARVDIVLGGWAGDVTLGVQLAQDVEQARLFLPLRGEFTRIAKLGADAQ